MDKDTRVAFYRAGSLSYYESDMRLEDALGLFVSDDAREKTELIRSQFSTEIQAGFEGFNKRPYQELKKSILDSIVFSGVIDRNTGVGTYSGLIVFDIDSHDKTLLSKFYSKPPKFCLAHAWSVSGAPNGFAIFNTTATDEKEFKRIAAGIRAYIGINYNLHDIKLSDSKRIRYISYDKDIFVDWDCEQVDPDWAAEWTAKYFTQEREQSRVADGISTQDWVEFCRQYAEGHGHEYKADSRHMFRVYFAIAANLLGVPRIHCEDYIRERYNSADGNLRNSISYPYYAYRENHGRWGWRLQEGKRTSYILKPSEYISDIKADLTGKIIYADTGTGKTRWAVGHFDKLIIAVPYYSLCENIASEYNIASFSGRKKFDGPAPDKIVTTFASVKTLVRKLGKKAGNYHFVVDEGHNLTISATRGFMLSDLTYIIECLELQRFQSNTILSGTWLFNIHPILKEMEVVRVQKPRITKKLHYIRADHTLQATIDLVKESVACGRFPFVLQNDTSIKRDTLIGMLKGVKVKSFTSRSKQDADFKAIVEESMIQPGIEAIVTTTVLKEGNNINNPVAVDIIVVGNYHSSEIEQVSQRFRKARAINIYMVKSIDGIRSAQWGDARQFTWDRYQLAKEELKQIKALSVLEGNFRKMIDMLPFRFNVDDDPVLDYLLISQHGTEQEKILENRNLELMCNNLRPYNIEYAGVMRMGGKLQVTEEVEKMLANKEAEKEHQYKERLTILQINPSPQKAAQEMERFSGHNLSAGDKLAVHYFNRLCQYNSPKVVLKWMLEMDPVANRLKKLERYFLFNATYHISKVRNRVELQFLQDVLDFTPNHDSWPDIANMIADLGKKYKIGSSNIDKEILKWGSNPKATISTTFVSTRGFIESMFKVKSNRVRINGNRVTQLEFKRRPEIPIQTDLKLDVVMQDFFTKL